MEKKNVFFPQERWKEANLEKHAFLDYFLAFGSGKYQCPGRSVRQLGCIYPPSLQKDDGSEWESFSFLLFVISLQGKPGDHILFGRLVMLCHISVRMAKAASDRRPPENKLLKLQLPDESRVYVHSARLSYTDSS